MILSTPLAFRVAVPGMKDDRRGGGADGSGVLSREIGLNGDTLLLWSLAKVFTRSVLAGLLRLGRKAFREERRLPKRLFMEFLCLGGCGSDVWDEFDTTGLPSNLFTNAATPIQLDLFETVFSGSLSAPNRCALTCCRSASVNFAEAIGGVETGDATASTLTLRLATSESMTASRARLELDLLVSGLDRRLRFLASTTSI
jgi:hypothetical protein